MSMVSVIIPIYNVEEYLEACLDSVLNQTYDSYEIIAVNDGSTDNSAMILAKYAEKNQKIKVITINNQGQSVARNIGISAANGEYLIFLDSDDQISKNTLEICVRNIIEKNLDAIFFESDVILDGVDSSFNEDFKYERPKSLLNEVVTGEYFFITSIMSGKYIVSPCMYMFSKICLNDLRFHPGIIHEDNLFTTKLLLSGKLNRVFCLHENLFHRRLRPGSIMTQEKSKKHIDGYLVVVNELVKEMSIINDYFTKFAMLKFVSSILHGVLDLSTTIHKTWVPVALRISLLRIIIKINHSKYKYILMLRICIPHFYSYAHSLKSCIFKNRFFI